MKWRFAVLELYTPYVFHGDGEAHEASWPAEGTPADWIEEGLVGYCDGDVCDLLSCIPLWKIVALRIGSWISRRTDHVVVDGILP